MAHPTQVLSLLVLLLAVFHQSQASTVDVVEEFVSNNTNFAMKLFQEIAKQPDATNIFLSPYSISTAMAMLYSGASGNTKKQIAEVLGYPDKTDEMLKAAEEHTKALFRDQEDYELESANKLYMDDGYSVNDDFVNNLETAFDADSDEVGFSTEADKAREEINEWVADETKDNIKKLFPEGTITSATKVVLVNALYFKADWLRQFDKSNTKNEAFRTGADKSIQVPMMHQDKVLLKMKDDVDKKVTVLELPYEGQTTAMYIVLPDEDQDINVTGRLLNNAETLDNLFSSMYNAEVNISLPKFEVTQRMPLPSLLMALNITDLFSSNADLSGISDDGLYVSEIQHQAYISVDEEGTEASAATGIVTSRMSPRKKEFIVNRPFLIFIRDKQTKTNLFVGRIMDPGTATEPLLLRMMRSVGAPPDDDGSRTGGATMCRAGVALMLVLFALVNSLF